MENSEIKIIFLGTPDFGAIVLKGLVENGFKPVLVITEPDKPAGRKQILTPPSVKLIAEKYDIPLGQPDKIAKYEPQIKNLNPDLIITSAYGQILPENILRIPKYGCLNVHPSVLPKYRGPSPIQTAILNRDKETGVSIFKMDQGIDTGPVLGQKKIRMENNETSKTLSDKLAKLSIEILKDAIPLFVKGKFKTQQQQEKEATYTKIIRKEDGKINWQEPADNTEAKIRAFYPWPGAFTFWQKNDKNLLRIKIIKAGVLAEKSEKTEPEGKVFLFSGDKLAVKCRQDFLLIRELQVEGKNPVNSIDFIKGNPGFVGAVLK
jgi:methionyl-tRNA formyltransferase